MFQDGDRIRCLGQDGRGEGLLGILHKSDMVYIDQYCEWFIEFDKQQAFGHNADGSVKDGYGWFVELKNIERVEYKYNPDQTGDMEEDI